MKVLDEIVFNVMPTMDDLVKYEIQRHAFQELTNSYEQTAPVMILDRKIVGSTIDSEGNRHDKIVELRLETIQLDDSEWYLILVEANQGDVTIPPYIRYTAGRAFNFFEQHCPGYIQNYTDMLNDMEMDRKLCKSTWREHKEWLSND